VTVYLWESKAWFTLRTAPYIDARTWTYGAVSCRMSMQDIADANYMLLTVVVNRQRNATCREIDLSGMLHLYIR